MKKILTASLVFMALGALVIGCQGIGEASYHQETSFEAKGIEEIEVNNDSWDIVFKDTDSPNITVTCEGKQRDKKSEPVTINQDGEKMIITQQDQGGISGGFTFGKDGTIYISIPGHEIDTITLNNDAGDIKVKDVAVQNLVFTNDSGFEHIEGLTADKGEFSSKDGEFTLKDSSLNKLKVTSGSGDSYMTRVTSPDMTITSTAGEISVKEAEEGKRLHAETNSGDLTVSYSTPPASLKLMASSGSADIDVGLDGFIEQQNTEKSIEGMIGDGTNTLELISQAGTIIVE
ncbi:DUF4097 family beta strand repeat-containing protein [Paenibacillus sp. CN-4]|uniref:DUF4097 family beta strand repeat-containing protein n=1 Tax=Paenibacillus nanchangensis TaxID=3348343 RepID=UPI00397E682E